MTFRIKDQIYGTLVHLELTGLHDRQLFNKYKLQSNYYYKKNKSPKVAVVFYT